MRILFIILALFLSTGIFAQVRYSPNTPEVTVSGDSTTVIYVLSTVNNKPALQRRFEMFGVVEITRDTNPNSNSGKIYIEETYIPNDATFYVRDSIAFDSTSNHYFINYTTTGIDARLRVVTNAGDGVKFVKPKLVMWMYKNGLL